MHDFLTRVYSALAAARKRRRKRSAALEDKDRIVNKNSSGHDSQLCGTSGFVWFHCKFM